MSSYSRLEKQIAEYHEANTGYNNRDAMVFKQLSTIIAIISGLTAILAYISTSNLRNTFTIGHIQVPISAGIVYILGFVGYYAILGISTDMLSTHGAKVAIRKRLEQLEKAMSDYDHELTLWNIDILERDKHFFERILKGNDRKEREIDFMGITTIIFPVLWIIICVVFINSIMNRADREIQIYLEIVFVAVIIFSTMVTLVLRRQPSRKIERSTKAFFEKKFEEEDPWKYKTSSYEQKKYKQQIDKIADRLSNPRNILEIGCAEGEQTKIINETFPEAKITGMDISRTAIKRAKTKVSKENVRFYTADIIEDIDNLENQKFDVIIWSESIYYIGDRLTVPEMYNFVKKVSEKLSEGGILCMANIINHPHGDEMLITKKPILYCYKHLLESQLEKISDEEYEEYKEESGQTYTYQIWLFEKHIHKLGKHTD